ncbi:MAG: riboflavin synthase [Gemmatimonadetes bacterium]|nr:MAG: riboflavin synthase [Gemmatimonadota bacterium]
MFTGLVDDVGMIERVTPTAAGREFRIRCRYDDLTDGESVAVNGACLTVRSRGANWFAAAAVTTTLARTTMGAWSPGRRVNLERAIRVGDRFGGHMVQGHVDGVARVTGVRAAGDARLVDLALPHGLTDLMVRHGSVAIDGVSLTINDLPGPDIVQLSLIDYTLRHTALDALSEDDEVHVEADMIGKYVQKLVAAYRS